jgi:hypothetical protein
MRQRLLPAAVLLAALSLPASAQCVMCYRTAHAQNQARARVLDLGILLLGAPPFLILAGFIAFVFSKDRVGQREESEQAAVPAMDDEADCARY